MHAWVLRLPEVPGVWRWPAVAYVLSVALLLLAYHPTVTAMVSIWLRSETFAHAFVAPLIALWLVWRKRDELAGLVPAPLAWTLLPISAAVLAWLLGRLAGSNALEQLAFTAILVLAVPLVLGWQVARALTFPLAFLFFAVPIGEFMVPTMVQWTADFTVMALRMTGVPVYREGAQFVIPSGHWSVVEACSGIRYLMASFMVGSLFAYLNYSSNRRRWIFVALSIGVPVVANWLRAYLTVMLGHLSGNKLAAGIDHILYGWVFFGIVMTALFMVGSRWAEPAVAPRAQSGRARPTEPGRDASRRTWQLAVTAGLLLLLPPALMSNEEAQRTTATSPAMRLPDQLAAGWRATGKPLTNWKPVFTQANAEWRQTYATDRHQVGLYIAYYRAQDQSRKLVSSANTLVRNEDKQWNRLGGAAFQRNDSGFTVTASDILAIAAPNATERERLKVWQWYWVGGVVTRSDLLAKLVSVWQRLSGQGDESAAVLVYSPQDATDDGTGALEAFVRDNWPMLNARLVETSLHR